MPRRGGRRNTSAYTDLDAEKDCTIFAAAAEGEGEWANLACNGYRGYPVLIYSGDLRESVFYGFPPDGDLAPAWESFSAFNSAGAKIEWRIETENGRSVPFAAIHRWFGQREAENRKTIEVLVVEKVGQMVEREGCAVGLVHRDRQSESQRGGAQGLRTSGRAISPAASTSARSSATRCRISAAARTDHFFLPRSIASTIISLARALSYQPPILTHLPGSRSL